ncbi:hypothetical protein ACFQY0_12675 [Haloferula chungangensis]|uniref:PEP-CTERM sorting domain-containing protein n=1 Tax=Haloferula chungangensis TaxID=1048331 RepID=A0ABW2L6K9_9BACT
MAPLHATVLNLTVNESFTVIDKVTMATSTLTVPRSTYVGSDYATHPGAVVNGALLTTTKEKSGSGNYRRMYTLENKSSIADGYNRDLAGDFESKVSGGFEAEAKITIEDLVDLGGYYKFSLDINEPENKQDVTDYVSLDEIQIYVGSATDPDPLPNTIATLSDLGTLVYDLQAGLSGSDRYSILLQGDNGSGRDEMAIYVPTSIFEDFGKDSFVYLYSKMGELGTEETDQSHMFEGAALDKGGFEEWAAQETGSAEFIVPVPATTGSSVPEPAQTLPIGALIMSGLLFGRRRSASDR